MHVHAHKVEKSIDQAQTQVDMSDICHAMFPPGMSLPNAEGCQFEIGRAGFGMPVKCVPGQSPADLIGVFSVTQLPTTPSGCAHTLEPLL